MKRAFWSLSGFILITFLVMGISISYILHDYLHSILESKVQRDLEMMATISQGALVSNDYERIEEEIMLWGDKDKNIIEFSMSIRNDAPLIKFVRNVETEHSAYFSHSINSPAGMQVNFEMAYNMSEHHLEKFYISLVFFSFAGIITLVFIFSLWMILQRFAIRPLQNEISVRKKAEEQTSESLQQIEIINANIPNIIWNTVVDKDGNLTNAYISNIVDEFLGLPPDTINNDLDKYFSYIDPSFIELINEKIRQAVNNIGTIFSVDYRIIKADDKIAWFSTTLRVQKENKKIALFGSTVDITENKRTIEDLIIAKEKAEESDRLKSAFLANMSHEIRTPMNGIMGFAELLKEPKLSGDSQKKYLRIIEESGERMLNIINDLMNISKIEAGQMGVSVSEININAQLEYLFSFFKPEAERRGLNLSLVNTLESKNVIIISDQEKLYAILLNLIKNAIKYTNKGSVEFGFSFCSDNSTASTASTSSATEESSTEESAKEESAKELEFYVKDTGIGIDNYQLEAIFERFVQADLSLSKPYEGVGLGLSIARAYVLMLGGKIRVESEVGKGSHFYFTIPYNYTKKEISTTNDIVSETMSERKGGNLKILIVEDEEVANTYLSILVEDIGKEILHAENGVKAVEICRQNQDIDLILMDIKMPEMNGYEATRQIRKTNKDVVVVAQTAFALMGDREKAIEAGCNDYITKPVQKEVLFSLIEKHLSIK